MSELLSPNYWPGVHVGSVVSLKDEQSLQHSMELGLGLKPMEYIVKQRWHVQEVDDLGTWWMYQLQQPEGEPELWLIVKVVDDAVDLRIYYLPEGLLVGNRVDQLNAGNDWLFTPGWDANVSLIGRPFAQSIAFGEGDAQVLYDNKGVTYGADVDITVLGGDGLARLDGLVTEYLANRECPDPELIIIEVGDAEDPDGGSISLLMGCPVNTSDLDVLRK